MDDALDAGELRLACHCRARRGIVHGELVIVTQCSLDRLEPLQRLLRCWEGPVVAAILLEDCAAEQRADVRAATHTIRAMCAGNPGCEKNDGCGGGGRLEALLYSRRRLGGSRARHRTGTAPPLPYPINALRNRSLAHAASARYGGGAEALVLIVDVDCVPTRDTRHALVGTPERAAALRRLCRTGAAVVVPCLELQTPNGGGGGDGSGGGGGDGDARAIAVAAASAAASTTADAKRALLEGRAAPFMEARWPVGHRATGFGAWAVSPSAGAPPLFSARPLPFEALFEPYVIVCAALAPRFDEKLSGYGRNKAAHALHLHFCGAPFVVAHGACVINVPHAPSRDFVASVARPDEMGKLRLAATKLRWEELSASFAACPTAAGVGNKGEDGERRGGAAAGGGARGLLGCIRSCSRRQPLRCATYGWPRWLPKEVRAAAAAAVAVAAADTAGVINGAARDEVAAAASFLAALCSRWMEYRAPLVRAELLVRPSGRCFPAGAAPGDVPVWLVTHLSADRLDRLTELLDLWPGRVAAAVWVGNEAATAGAVRSFVAALRGDDADDGRLSLSLVCGVPPEPGLYPANAIRSCALGAVPPDALAMLLDVDVRPPRALGAALAHRESAAWAVALRSAVRRECCERGRFLVLPALELATGEEAEENAALLLQASAPQDAAATLSATSRHLRAFHEVQCPEGHAPTRTATWLSQVASSASSASTATAAAAAVRDDALQSNDITFAYGYEPYGICEARRIAAVGGFDTCFVGWHRDRAEHYARLHQLSSTGLSGGLSGGGGGGSSGSMVCGFSLLRSAVTFLVDRPHAEVAARTVSRGNAMFVAAMEGLYQRSLRMRGALPEQATAAPSTEPVTARAMFAAVLDRTPLAPAESCAVRWLAGGPGTAELLRGGASGSVWDPEQGLWQVQGAGQHNITVTEGGVRVVHLAGGVGAPCSARLAGVKCAGIALRAASIAQHSAAGGAAMSLWVKFGAGDDSDVSGGDTAAVADTRFNWGCGGALPGLYCDSVAKAGLGLHASFRWGASGELGFVARTERGGRNAVRTPPNAEKRRLRDTNSRMSVQLMPGAWHRLEVAVRPGEGGVSAWCDGSCVFESARDAPPFGGGLCSVRLALFRSGDGSDVAAPSIVALRDVRFWGVDALDACATAAAEAAGRASSSAADLATEDATVETIIAEQLTVIFAPKEWQSTGPRALSTFLGVAAVHGGNAAGHDHSDSATAPPRPPPSVNIAAHEQHAGPRRALPRRLVLVIVPPMSASLERELRVIAEAGVAASGGAMELHVHVTTPLANPYEVRNELAAKHAADTRYVLHLNNDVLPCTKPVQLRGQGWQHHQGQELGGHCQWLRELVRYAEANEECWAVMPLLVERAPFESLKLHAWWASVTRQRQQPQPQGQAGCTGNEYEAALHARFDEHMCSLPLAALPGRLRHASRPLFLEDHCVLARTAHFGEASGGSGCTREPLEPLFDPQACWRREFFDLAWAIRRRGGEVGQAAGSVVVYERLAWCGQPQCPGGRVGGGGADGDSGGGCDGNGAAAFSVQHDLVGFAARRQDELAAASQLYVSAKWQVAYRTDRWHEVQRDHTLTGMRGELPPGDDGNSSDLGAEGRVRLALSLLVLAGFNRFRRAAVGPVLNAKQALCMLPAEAASTRAWEVEHNRTSSELCVQFWQEAVAAQAGQQTRCRGHDGGGDGVGSDDPLASVVPFIDEGMAPGAGPACASPFSTVCFLRFHGGHPPRASANACLARACFVANNAIFLWLRLEAVAGARCAAELALAVGAGVQVAVVTSVELAGLGTTLTHFAYRPLGQESLGRLNEELRRCRE